MRSSKISTILPTVTSRKYRSIEISTNAYGYTVRYSSSQFASFEIEMIRRLIQKQQVRLLQQQLGKRDAHLPSAREFVSLPIPIVLTKSESSEHAAHLRLDGIAVTGLKFMLYTLIAIGDLCILRRGVVQL